VQRAPSGAPHALKQRSVSAAPDGDSYWSRGAPAIRPAAAFYSNELGEFILPWDAVRTAPDSDRALMDFLVSTYEAAASLGKWDRVALECAPGVTGRPRAI
jgi:hypothetical protein